MGGPALGGACARGPAVSAPGRNIDFSSNDVIICRIRCVSPTDMIPSGGRGFYLQLSRTRDSLWEGAWGYPHFFQLCVGRHPLLRLQSFLPLPYEVRGSNSSKHLIPGLKRKRCGWFSEASHTSLSSDSTSDWTRSSVRVRFIETRGKSGGKGGKWIVEGKLREWIMQTGSRSTTSDSEAPLFPHPCTQKTTSAWLTDQCRSLWFFKGAQTPPSYLKFKFRTTDSLKFPSDGTFVCPIFLLFIDLLRSFIYPASYENPHQITSSPATEQRLEGRCLAVPGFPGNRHL